MFTADEIRAMIAADDMHRFYADYDWRRLARSVIADNHSECRICRTEHRLKRAVLVHHVLHLRDRPDLAYDRTNLMPLCRDCHERIHGRGAYSAHHGFTNDERW